nr:unnamed protein product [Callosobruchus chinensis]
MKYTIMREPGLWSSITAGAAFARDLHRPGKRWRQTLKPGEIWWELGPWIVQTNQIILSVEILKS